MTTDTHELTVQSPTEAPSHAKSPEPWVKVFSKGQLVAIGLGSLLTAALLLASALAFPTRVDGAFSRNLLCFTVSLFSGIFLFVIYPWEYRLTKIPGLDATVEVVGPAALVVILTFFLLYIIPSPESGRFHRLQDAEGNNWSPTFSAKYVKVTFPDQPTEPSRAFAINPHDGAVFGIYLVYPENQPFLNARIDFGGGFKVQDVVFQRDNNRPLRVRIER